MRTKLSDVMASRIPQVVGLCSTNFLAVASYINEAQQRLINAMGETGAWAGWAKVVFQVNRCTPFITLPAAFARAVNIDVCRTPIRVQNEWMEMLVDGVGLQTIPDGNGGCGPLAAYDRGNIATAYDLTPTNQYLRVYLTDARDVGKRILISGALDQNGVAVYSSDGLLTVNGFYMVLNTPFTTTSFIVAGFAAISKDVTYGDVILKQVDATTGVEVLLARYTPKETNPAYRRYYLHSLPGNCCSCPTTPLFAQVTAMLKYEYQPVAQPSDFLVIGSIPALKAEVEAIRYEEMDVANGQQFSILKHREAIKRLNQELVHYLGDTMPAINVRPSGVIGLRCLQIGSMR